MWNYSILKKRSLGGPGGIGRSRTTSMSLACTLRSAVIVRAHMWGPELVELRKLPDGARGEGAPARGGRQVGRRGAGGG